MTIFTVFAITGCNPNGEEGEKETRKFWAKNFKTDTYYQVNAEKFAENSRCVVWAEKGSGVDETTANNMATAYNTVYAKMMSTFGWEIDDEELYRFGGENLKKMDTMEVAHYIISANEGTASKLTILLLDIKDNYSSTNKGYTAGYFHSLNFMKNDPNNSKYPLLKYSNELDMIYVDINPGKPGSAESNRTLAHEMQHLMNFVSSQVIRDDIMDIWIDEGLSTAAEWLYDNPEDRINWFNNNGNKSMKGKINEGNNFYVWENDLDDYATAYIFFQYLRLQSKKPNDIYFDILTSESYDYKAVIKAESINSSHKNNWEKLLGDWFAANYINAPSGLYGYMDDDKLKNVKAPMYPKSTKTVNLFPGEGIYSKISGASTTKVPDSSGKIRYKGFNFSGDPVASGGNASVARLTYNVEEDNTEISASGETTGVASSVDISMSVSSSSLQIASSNFLAPYVVDSGCFLRENRKHVRSADGIRSAVINDGENTGKSNIPKVDRAKLKRVIVDE